MKIIDIQKIASWQIINDSVMGGASKSQLNLIDKNLVFTGCLSFANSGGFASVRYQLDKNIIDKKRIAISVKGNQRRFQLRLRTNIESTAIAYKVEFIALEIEQTLVFTEDDFKGTFRGKDRHDAAPLAFSDVKQISFLIADKCNHEFYLQVKSIDFI